MRILRTYKTNVQVGHFMPSRKHVLQHLAPVSEMLLVYDALLAVRYDSLLLDDWRLKIIGTGKDTTGVI